MLPNRSRTNQIDAKISIFPILTINFVGTLGFSIVLPFLVFLVTRFGGNAIIYGVIGATYPAFQLIGAPILGHWSDRYGRRKILLLSQLGTLLSWAIFLIAFFVPLNPIREINSAYLGKFTITFPLVILFIARALDGLTGGNISVANAYLADITAEKERNTNFGKMGISANLGFILGPALAGVLGATSLGEIPPVLAALVISVIASLMILFMLPESKSCQLEDNPESMNVHKILGQDQKECFKISGAEHIRFKDILKLNNFPFLMTIYFLIFLGFNLFYTAFPVHAVTGLDWSVTETGVFFSVLGLLMAITQGPVLKWASKRWSDAKLIIGGGIILASNFALLYFPNIWLIYLAAALFALGNGTMWPSVMSIISKIAGDKYQGAVQGFASSFGSIASIIGLIVGGFLYSFMGAGIFLFSAVIIYGVSIISIKLLRTK